MTTKRLTVLGATGSIGDSTLDLIRRAEPGQFQIVALTANRNAQKLADLALEFNAEFVALADPEGRSELQSRLNGSNIQIGIGRDAVLHAGKMATDFCMAAIIGAAGLEPTLAAVDQGITVGLANKECLVCGGDLFMQRVKRAGATLLPVDSEHNAIFQVLEHDKPEGVVRLILTASGGPFRTFSYEDIKNVTCEDALNHPVWDMGAKISIDSATLMNKGLELIEASYLFDRPSDEIDIVVHPQSVIHSMVEYVDGSVLAQLGSPDMRTPIAYSLGWPKRMKAPVERLNFSQISALTFFEPDTDKFPALKLAREALETGGSAPNILNASNEIAVAAFLDEKISFLDMSTVVYRVLERFSQESAFTKTLHDLSQIIAVDESARCAASEVIKSL